MSLHARELRELAVLAEDRNWLESDVDTLRMAAVGIERLEDQLERLAAENAAIKDDVEKKSNDIKWLDGVVSRVTTELRAKETENERLQAELDKVCEQRSLVRCKGCGDYIFHTDIADEKRGYCWGCQDEIDDNGEIGEEYRIDADKEFELRARKDAGEFH